MYPVSMEAASWTFRIQVPSGDSPERLAD